MTRVLELDALSVQYGGGRSRHTALDQISLTVESGEYLTIVGANGAGKSTLVNVIAGSVSPSEGRAYIDGRDVTRHGDHRRAAKVGRVFQDVSDSACAELTVGENLLLAHLRAKRKSPFRLAARGGRLTVIRDELAAFGVGLEDKINSPVGSLSGGQRQLVSLLMAVCEAPKILLLDEHTSALDPQMAQLVMDRTDAVITGNNLTALMITHNMSHAAAYGHRVLIMMRGRIVDDISGPERQELGSEQLIARFRAHALDAVTDTLLGD